MRAHARTAFTLMLVLTACAAKAREPLRIAVTGFKTPRPERYLMGEPVRIQIAWENVSNEPLAIAYGVALRTPRARLHVNGEQLSDCNLLSALSSLGYLGGDQHQIIAPGGKVVLTDDATAMGMVEAGQYEIWLEYDASGVGRDFAHGIVAPIRVESNRFRFEIVEPSGVDAEVLARFGNSCRKIQFGDAQHNVIADYPFSTYAGLLQGGVTGTGPLPEPFGLPSPDDRGYAEQKKQVESMNAGTATQYAEDVERLTRYLAARPDFDGADQMRFRIAWYQDYLGELDQARLALKGLLAKEDLPPWLRSECNRLLEHVERKARAHQ